MGKKRLKNIIILIVLFEVFILINALFAQSYIISESYSFEEKTKVDIFEKILDKTGKVLISFFSIKQVGIVSAGDLKAFCCKKTIEGSVCEDIFAENSGLAELQCQGELFATKCDSFEECRLGCCVDGNEGACTPRSPKELCENNGGVWEDSQSCSSIDFCQKACCKLAGNYKFTTEKECEKLSESFGLTMNFDSGITSEPACLFLKDANVKGACVFEDAYEGNQCSIETKSDCKGKRGNFYEGLLCTNSKLKTICEKTENTICLDEGINRGVYFIDSCGNIANVYDSSKVNSDSYWQKMESERSVCNLNDNNVEDCGNCKFYAGSICGAAEDSGITPTHGNFVCRSVDCDDAPVQIDSQGDILETEDKRNGETWCIYESAIGIEKSPFGNDISVDTVGSNHWRASCVNGKVEYELCGDARSGICSQQEINDPNVNEFFTIASCVTNEANLCLMTNRDVAEECQQLRKPDRLKCMEEFMGNNCVSNSQCRLGSVEIDDFKFDLCLPKYPKGFDLKPESSGSEGNKMVCSLASKQCTVVYKKDALGDWKCEENCDCSEGGNDPSDFTPSKELIQKMNDMCVSLGDCGTYVNYVGEGTENVEIDPEPEKVNEVEGSDYLKFKDSIFEKVAKVELSEEMTAELVGINNGGDVGQYDLTGLNNFMMGIEGASTIVSLFASQLGLTETVAVFDSSTSAFAKVPGSYMYETAEVLGPFASAIVGAAIGAAVGQLLADQLGYQGESILLAVGGGALAGLYIGYNFASVSAAVTQAIAAYTAAGSISSGLGAAFGSIAASLGSIPVFGWVVLAVATVAMAWGAITGFGEVKTKVVTFECLPWQAKTNSNECEICNENELGLPCTEYKCNSLGQNCKLVNKDSTQPECITTKDDGIPPEISEGEIITSGFEFSDKGTAKIKIKSEMPQNDGKYCINAFTPLIFSLQTDEHAQCKYSFSDPSAVEFENMDGAFPLEQNYFSLNHTFLFNFPSIDIFNKSISEEFNEELRKTYAGMRVYIKCQDYWENDNVAPYIIEFCVAEDDLTAVDPNGITFIPEHNAYLAFNTTQKEISVILPEPSSCKYSTRSGQGYENMENEMDCNPIENITLEKSIICQTTLDNLFEGNNEFYFKCNDSAGNINGDDINYNLIVSGDELKIDYIDLTVDSEKNIFVDNEGKEVIIGEPPIKITMSVKTSKGAKKGESTCYYTFDENKKNNPNLKFMETDSNLHKQEFDQMITGNFSIYVKCKDAARNIALDSKEIDVHIDVSPPLITRAFIDDATDKLIFSTDEEAKCAFSISDCDFDIDSAEYSISETYKKDHETEHFREVVYHIKCADKWGNINPGCAGIVRSYKDL